MNVLTLFFHSLSALLIVIILSPSLGESVMVVWQTIGGIAGLASILWLVVDWAKKDEKAKSQAEQVVKLEQRVNILEDGAEHRDAWLLEQVSNIAIGLARVETHLGIEPNKSVLKHPLNQK